MGQTSSTRGFIPTVPYWPQSRTTTWEEEKPRAVAWVQDRLPRIWPTLHTSPLADLIIPARPVNDTASALETQFMRANVDH